MMSKQDPITDKPVLKIHSCLNSDNNTYIAPTHFFLSTFFLKNTDKYFFFLNWINRYGVIDVFEAEDLLELKNIPKVTKCLAQLSKLAASDKDNLLNSF